MIIDHTSKAYKKRWESAGLNRYNGAYYYSLEIKKNIIPKIETDRHWVTVNIPVHNAVSQFAPPCCDHSIVFIHNNMHPENYAWLKNFKDLILVCGIPETADNMTHLGHAVYLPLSIDVDYVRQFIKPKTKGTAYVGRKAKRDGLNLGDVDYLEGMPRKELLSKMAEYEKIMAVGRTALEGLALGCEILPYDERFPDPAVWKLMDNAEAVPILQKYIDEIDQS